jgi:RNA polymerase sigma-70 factor, ECF subfamily
MDLPKHGGLSTDSGLLRRLRQLQDAQAWDQFVERYGPYLEAILLCRGISRHEALDLVQDTFAAVVDNIGDFEYDRSKKFHAWLATIALRKAWRFLERARRGPRACGGSAHAAMVQEIADRPGEAEDLADRQALLAMALRRAREEVSQPLWAVFELTVLQGVATKEAAAILGITPGCVDVRKFRVLKVVRRILQQLEADNE